MSSVSGLLEESFPPQETLLWMIYYLVFDSRINLNRISAYALELCLIDQGEI